MRDYENDRWRIISSKVGNGFSPAACKEKAGELGEEGEDVVETEGEEEEGMEQAPSGIPGSVLSEVPQEHLYHQ